VAAYSIYLNKMHPKLDEKQHWTYYLYVACYFLYELKDISKFFKIITNLLEIDPENVQFYRIVVYLLDQNFIKNDLSRKVILDIYRKIYEMRPEEPISMRDLTLSLTEFSTTLDKNTWSPYLENSKFFKKLIETQWDKRFKTNQIEIPVLEELNAMLKYLSEKHVVNLFDGNDRLIFECQNMLKNKNSFMEPLLQTTLDMDLRIAISWDHPQANVELHVHEPNGKICYSMNNITPSGGILSADCNGYGPVIYSLRKAEIGIYNIKVKLFSRISSQDPVVVSVSVWTNFAEKKEIWDKRSVILEKEKQIVEIAQVSFLTTLK